MPDFIAYFRVSTERQGASGLGLEAQRAAVDAYVQRFGGVLVGAFEEVESGKRSDRPQLAAALSACRARRACLLVAKIDRLARNTAFLLSVVEGCGPGGVAFCDLPDLPPGPMGKFFLTLMAAVAELEAGLISQRTKAALAAAKARGVKLGGPGGGIRTDAARTGRVRMAERADRRADDVMPAIQQARQAGAASLRDLAKALTARGIRPPRGGERWSAQQVRRAINRATS